MVGFLARAALSLALLGVLALGASAIGTSPTATASVSSFFWGDEDCSGSINALDTITTLFQRTGGDPNLPENCPRPGDSLVRNNIEEVFWSDMNCSGNIEGDTEEALYPLRYLLFGFTGPGGPCPAIGELVSESQN